MTFFVTRNNEIHVYFSVGYDSLTLVFMTFQIITLFQLKRRSTRTLMSYHQAIIDI